MKKFKIFIKKILPKKYYIKLLYLYRTHETGRKKLLLYNALKTAFS